MAVWSLMLNVVDEYDRRATFVDLVKEDDREKAITLRVESNEIMVQRILVVANLVILVGAACWRSDGCS